MFNYFKNIKSVFVSQENNRDGITAQNKLFF